MTVCRPHALGVDIVDVRRLRGRARRSGEVLLQRLFTDLERDLSRGRNGYRWTSLAGRLAAKEATRKVLGCRGEAAGWRDIEVRTGEFGEPLLWLHGAAIGAVERCGYRELLLSITHEKETAVAVVIAA